MGWIRVVVVVGSLVGCAAWEDHRRYRESPASLELSGRAKPKAVRPSRTRMAHLESPARYSRFTRGGGGDWKLATSSESSMTSAAPFVVRRNGATTSIQSHTKAGWL